MKRRRMVRFRFDNVEESRRRVRRPMCEQRLLEDAEFAWSEAVRQHVGQRHVHQRLRRRAEHDAQLVREVQLLAKLSAVSARRRRRRQQTQRLGAVERRIANCKLLGVNGVVERHRRELDVHAEVDVAVVGQRRRTNLTKPKNKKSVPN